MAKCNLSLKECNEIINGGVRIYCCMCCDGYHEEDRYYCKDCRYENGEIVSVKLPGRIGIGKVVNNPKFFRKELKYEVHGKINGVDFITITSPYNINRCGT